MSTSKPSGKRSSSDSAASSDKQIAEFHRSRRMFAVVEKTLLVSEPHSTCSHTEWFEQEGILSRDDKATFELVVRGFVDDSGVYFYHGAKFEFQPWAEEQALQILPELISKLGVPHSHSVFGGMVRQPEPGRWPPQKCLGTVAELLNSQTN